MNENLGVMNIWPEKQFPPFVRLEDKRGNSEVYYRERTCHDITPLLSNGLPYPDTFTCSECGYKMEGVVYPNHCINCGARFDTAIEAEPVRYVPERTCFNEDDDETDAWFMCSECECHVLIEYMGGGFGVPHYCPGCGAKVVE